MNSFEKVEQIRKERNVSRSKLERLSGIGSGLIGKWKFTNPKMNTLAKVAAVLGVDATELLPDSREYPAALTIETYDSNCMETHELVKLNYINKIQIVLSEDYAPLFKKGDILLIDSVSQLNNNDIIALKSDNRLQLMKYAKLDGLVSNTLIPINETDAITVKSVVLGKVVEVKRVL